MSKSPYNPGRSTDSSLARDERPLLVLPRGGDFRAIVAYPNRYWLAMSNLGFQTVYRCFSEQPRFSVERAYVPEDDTAAVSTFETAASLSDADLLAISVSFETDYPYVLRVIEAAGVVLERRREMLRAASGEPDSSDRGTDQSDDDARGRPFILGGGAALTLNPEPLANFFDAIVIGEGEEVIPEISPLLIRWREGAISYPELLDALSRLEGVYVPSLFEVSYRPDGPIDAIRPRARRGEGPAPKRPNRRFVRNIDAFPTHTIVQTPHTEFKSMFMTETGRGCEVGCKFCVAGYMYRPIRKRSAEVIAETVQLGIESGESVGFVGAAVSSHPQIAELARSVARSGKRAALSSIMSQRVTPELAASLSESEYKTVALAPECGSERLRFRVGKRVCDDQIVQGVETLAREGIRNFKLYFMVGLPAEAIEDVRAIVALSARCQAAALRAARESPDFRTAPRLLLSVNPFIPKAWTPFQRHPMLDSKTLKTRLQLVRKGIGRIPNVEMKHESPRESYFQAVLSRGDRRVGDMLLVLHERGEDWRGLVRHGETTLVEGVPAPDFYARRLIDADELLPWEAVDLRIKRDLLERQYARTFDEDVDGLIARAREQLRRDAADHCESAGGETCQSFTIEERA